MLSAPKILLVDDDPTFVLVIRRCLGSVGYRVIDCKDGTGLTELVRAENPALVVLDIQMPNRDGWQALEDLRQRGSSVPVLMLTGSFEVEERVRGLHGGADDYVVKGCSPAEFLARVHALLRRAEIASPKSRWLNVDGVTVDLENKAAWRDGEPVALTRTEYLLLKLFAQNIGKPVSREMMIDRIWGYSQQADTRTIDTHLWRLRKKLSGGGEDTGWLRNLPGLGYVAIGEIGEAAAPAEDFMAAVG